MAVCCTSRRQKRESSPSCRKVGTLIRKHVSAPMPVLIKKLNEMLRGWANYHRHVVASEAFGRIDTYVFEQLWRMIRRRHHNKSEEWLTKKYWSAAGRKNVFAVCIKDRKGVEKLYQVLRVSSIGIQKIYQNQSGCKSLSARIRRIFLASKA